MGGPDEKTACAVLRSLKTILAITIVPDQPLNGDKRLCVCSNLPGLNFIQERS